MQRDGWSIKQRAKAGKLPAWVLEEPAVNWAEQEVLDAFFSLCSCRSFGAGPTPIPWTAIVQYADRLRLPEASILGFVIAVQLLDDVFIAQLPKVGAPPSKGPENG